MPKYTPGWMTTPGKGRQRFAGGGLRGVLDVLSGIGSAAGRAVRSGIQGLRDEVVIPIIDKGLESGVIEPRVGMFGRYLTGTSKPLNSLPPAVASGIYSQMGNYQADTDNWRGPNSFDVRNKPTGRGDMGTAYAPGVPIELQNTLGQFSVTPNGRGGREVRDVYRFDGLRDATNGGDAAKNVIRLAQQLGMIRSDFGSEYEIRAPLR